MFEPGLIDSPIRVYWAGWSSDTYTLKRNGWEVFASQEMAKYSFEHVVHLGLRDPSGGMCIMGEIRVSPEHLLGRFGGPNIVNLLQDVGVEMKGFKAADRITTYLTSSDLIRSWDSMQPFDGLAYVPYGPETSQSFADLKLFKYQAPREIFVPYNSVDECLNRALQLQYPEQQIIKAQQRPIVQATVYSVAA